MTANGSPSTEIPIKVDVRYISGLIWITSDYLNYAQTCSSHVYEDRTVSMLRVLLMQIRCSCETVCLEKFST